MKQLNRIILVNWYLFDRVEIEVRGNTAIIGPNASGKSSLLDAVQTVLTGGDKRFLALNAGTDGKSYRNIREYCLGFMYDPSDTEGYNPDLRPRENALSYLALSFRDTETNDETCIGLAISASLAEANEKVEGRFIVPGMSARLSDFVKQTQKGEVPNSWAEMKENLGRRFSCFEVEPRPEMFVRKLVAELSYDNGSPNDHQKFLRNFRSAISFVPIKDPTEFVRRYVLDAKPVPVAELRSALKNYRFLSERTTTVQKRIDSLKQISKMCDDVRSHFENTIDYSWIEHEAAFEKVEEQAEPLREEMGTLEEKLSGLVAREQELSSEVDNAAAELMERTIELQRSDTASAITALQAELKSVDQQEKMSQGSIDRIRIALTALLPIFELREHLPTGLLAPVEEIVGTLRGSEGILSSIWPEYPATVDSAITRLAGAIASHREEIRNRFESFVEEEAILKRELDQLKKAIETLKQGDALLDARTRELMRILDAQGIPSTPLCDLVDLEPEQERWRTAVESYLGGLREALIVDPKHAKDAVRIFRHEGRHLKGCRIVNTMQTDKWLDRVEKGSLGELIVTDNPHAKAYANRMLGNVIRVETEAELLKHERAITPDCMLHASGSTTAMREEEPMLGGDSRRRNLERKIEELTAKGNKVTELTERKKGASAVDTVVSRLGEQLSVLTDPLEVLVKGRDEAKRQVAEIKERIRALQNKEDKGLKGRIAELEILLQRSKDELREVQTTLRDSRDRRIAVETQLKILNDKGSSHDGHRKTASEEEGFDRVRAVEKLQKFFNRLNGDYGKISEDANRRKIDSRELHVKRMQQVVSAVADHQSVYHGTGAVRELGTTNEAAVPYEQIEDYVRRTLKELEDSQLAEYREQAEMALRAAEIAFRSEFVSQLQDQFARSRETIRELNNHLKNRPFHGEFYTFHQTPNPLFEDVYKFITESTPEEQQNAGGLFDAGLDPNSPQHKVIEKIGRALQDEAESRMLEDYREYFNFEVKMQDAEGRLRASLSQRIKKGSGGENQAPFYVSIGAALASTYRIREKHDGSVEGGIALVAFDEAFSKLDVQNTINCLSFLRDIHLQVLLCAPDEKYGLMSEMMDTIVNICRDGAAVEIDVEYPTVEARELLSRDNPYRRKHLIIEPAEQGIALPAR